MNFSKYNTKKLQYQVGDLYKSEDLKRYVMKNEKYPISHVMYKNNSSGFDIYVTDKNGTDTRVGNFNSFQLSIDKNLVSLILMCKYKIPHHYWNSQTNERGYIIFRDCNMLNIKGSFTVETQTYIGNYLRNEPKYLTSPRDENCVVDYYHDYDHFMSTMLEKYNNYVFFNRDYKEQTYDTLYDTEICNLYGFEQYDESKLNLPGVSLYDEIRDKNKSIVEFQNIYSDVFYGCEAKDMSDESKTLTNAIIDCFINAPGTFGPTAISKFLTGKLKKNIKNCEAYNGMSSMSQTKLFLQCDMIETIMYTIGILKGQELYDSNLPVFINGTAIKENNGSTLKF